MSWQQFYKEIFDLDVAQEPDVPGLGYEFCAPILVHRDLSLLRVLMHYANHHDMTFDGNQFPLAEWWWEKKVRHDPRPVGTYSLWIRGQCEGDVQHRYKNVSEIDAEGVKGINFLERLIWGLYFKYRTNTFPDQHTVTICSATRFIWQNRLKRQEEEYVAAVFSRKGAVCLQWRHCREPWKKEGLDAFRVREVQGLIAG